MSPYRRSPRPVALPLDRIRDELAPQTLLADVQRAWPQAVGDTIAAEARPTDRTGRDADRRLLGIGVGAGARPDGSDDPRATELVPARRRDHAAAMRGGPGPGRSLTGEVVTRA